jgi:hypothetical protein
MNNTLIKEYVALSERKKVLAAEGKAVAHQMTLLENQVIDEIHNAGLTAVSADGRTIELQEDVYVTARGSHEQVVAALRGAGLEQYIAPESYNEKSIAKYVREIWDDLRGAGERPNLVTERDLRAVIPEGINALLRIAFVFKLGNKKA